MFHPNDPIRGNMLLGLEKSMQEERELIERRRRFAKARKGDYLRIDLPDGTTTDYEVESVVDYDVEVDEVALVLETL